MRAILNHAGPERKEKVAVCGNILGHGFDPVVEFAAPDAVSVGVTYS